MVDPGYLAFSFVAAAATVAVGAWLFWVDPGRPLSRVFATYLLLRGLRGFVRTMMHITVGTGDAEYWSALLPYFDIASTPVLVYFIIIYSLRNRTLLTLSFMGVLAFVGIAEVAYATDHCSHACPASGLGPLSILTSWAPFVGAVGGLAFAIEAIRRREEARGRAAIYVSAGLTFVATVETNAFVTALASNGYRRILETNGAGPYAIAFIAAQTVGWLVCLATIGLWWYGARGDNGKQAQSRRFSIFAGGAVVSGMVVDFVDTYQFFTDFFTF
ncbi:MAG TPA: hypothetical protein VGB18_06265, partial [Candidatus Thermoplasmatota archaeon]